MTTLTEIAESQTAEYEPTVSDKIQRVLYRLDHGELLAQGSLKVGAKYCIIGMFMDEHGVDWDKPYHIEPILQYYNFKEHMRGEFDIDDLPAVILARLTKLLGIDYVKARQNREGKMSLMSLNDTLITMGTLDSDAINGILADVIRSGVLFNKD